MEPVKVLRQGKGTFCEWRFENGQSRGRILNPGAGVLLDTLFSSAEEAKTFCEEKLKQDASAIFYVVQGEAIIDAIQDDAYHQVKEIRQNRILALVSVIVVMLMASVVSSMFMPFQLVVYDVIFIAGIGVFYLLLYSIGGRWHLEGVVATIMLLIMLSVAVPLLGE